MYVGLINMAYRHFVKENEDGSKTTTTIYEAPGISIKKKVTVIDCDNDDDFEDIADKLIIKKVSKDKCDKCVKCKVSEDFIAKLIDELDMDTPTNDIEELVDDLNGVPARLSEKYPIEDLSGLKDALPKLLADEKIMNMLVDVLMNIYVHEFKE